MYLKNQFFDINGFISLLSIKVKVKERWEMGRFRDFLAYFAMMNSFSGIVRYFPGY